MAISKEPESSGRIDVGMVAVLVLPALFIANGMLHDRRFGLLEGMIIYSHEGGHPLFALLGPFMGSAGGTLMQLLVPVAFMVTFYFRGQRLSAAVVSFWLAASFANASVYAQDAIDQELPLIHTGMSASEEIEEFGGTEHDWVNMLDMLHWPVQWAHGISILLYLAGVAVWFAGLGMGLKACGVPLAWPQPGAKPRKKAVRRPTVRRKN
jgi:hypothetical protein